MHLGLKKANGEISAPQLLVGCSPQPQRHYATLNPVQAGTDQQAGNGILLFVLLWAFVGSAETEFGSVFGLRGMFRLQAKGT